MRAICDRYNVVLILDEVFCGMGRSGRHFAVQAYGVEPDILTLAKSLGGGIPCAAILTTAEVSGRINKGDLGSTFGGGPIAAAAIVAVIDAIRTEDLLDNVRRCEAAIRAQCVTGPVTGIQGMGLLLGLVCDRPAAEVQKALLDHDILTGTSVDRHILRLLPPLVLKEEQVQRLARALAAIAPGERAQT